MSARIRCRAMLQNEHYWHDRALRETTAALRSDDPHVAALHVELATKCVRNALEEREREEQELSVPPASQRS